MKRITIFILVLTLAAGMLLGLPWHVLLPEACGLLCGGMVWGIWMSVRGLWGAADERIAGERQVCLSTSWTVMHCAALIVSTVMMLFDRENSTVYVLTGLAMTLIMYCCMGRMTSKGLYSAQKGQKTWQRVLCVTAVTLALCPVMMWTMGMYILLEGVMLAACLLGGVLAQFMAKQSSVNAEKQLAEAEGADEE